MQTKTIKKVLKNKMNEWLSTITDDNLRGDVEKSLLVSGGSIASMFLKEDINDFDVYLGSKDVVMRLAKYYTKDYPNIKILDGTEKADLIEELKEEKGIDVDVHENSYTIALKNLKKDQIRLYFDNAQPGHRVDWEGEELPTYRPLYFSPNAISLSDDLQIVLRFHGTPEQVHETFDFIHATNYFTMKEGLVTNIKALESLITKQLKYQGSHYPLTSIIRSKKFINRGWNISAGEYLKIMFQISELNLKDPAVLDEQLIGVDVAYFSTLISILKGVDKEKISSNFLNTIIDRVFDGDEEVE